METTEIIKLLRARYGSPKVLVFEELRLGAGWGGVSERRVDLLVLGTAPSGGHHVTIFEVKTNRRDFQSDIGDFKKQRGARLFADEFYFVVPVGMVSLEEVPIWAGLIEVQSGHLSTTAKAPRLDKPAPTWGLVVAMVRNASKGEG